MVTCFLFAGRVCLVFRLACTFLFQADNGGAQELVYGKVHDGLIKLGIRARKSSDEILQYQTFTEIVKEMLDILDVGRRNRPRPRMATACPTVPKVCLQGGRTFPESLRGEGFLSLEGLGPRPAQFV